MQDLGQHPRFVIADLVYDDQMAFEMGKVLLYTCEDGGLRKVINRIIEYIGIVIVTIVVISSYEP